MPDVYEYVTYSEAMLAIEQGVADTKSDDVSEEDAGHDIAISLFRWMTPEVRSEVARCWLGWDNVGDRDLYVQHEIPTTG